MVEIVSTSCVRRVVRAVGLGLVSAFVAEFCHAQNPLTTLPGTNAAQQTMAGSIAAVCPPLTPVTPNQQDLKTICSAMIGNALQLQGQSFQGFGTYGLDTDGLKALCRV